MVPESRSGIKIGRDLQNGSVSSPANEQVFSHHKSIMTANRTTMGDKQVEYLVKISHESRRRLGENSFKLVDLIPKTLQYVAEARAARNVKKASMMARLRAKRKAERGTAVSSSVSVSSSSNPIASSLPVTNSGANTSALTGITKKAKFVQSKLFASSSKVSGASKKRKVASPLAAYDLSEDRLLASYSRIPTPSLSLIRRTTKATSFIWKVM